MEICISTQGINLGGDVGLTIGINGKMKLTNKEEILRVKELE
jgi:hypothetical protein